MLYNISVNEHDLYSELDRETFFLKPRQILRTLKSKRLVLTTFFIGFLTAGNFYYLFFHSEYWTAKTQLRAIGTKPTNKQINILAADIYSVDILNQVLANAITQKVRLSAIIPKPRLNEVLTWLKNERSKGIEHLMKNDKWTELLTYLRSTISTDLYSEEQITIEVRTRNAGVSLTLAGYLGESLRQYHYLNQKIKIQEMENFVTAKIEKIDQEIIQNEYLGLGDTKNIKLQLKEKLILELAKQKKAKSDLAIDTEIVKKAYLADNYVRPTVGVKVIIVALTGLILTLLALLFKTVFFYRVRFLSDFEQLGLIPTTEIPRLELSESPNPPLLLDYSNKDFHQPFDQLHMKLTKKFEVRRKKLRQGQILLVTGPVISSGKSFVAANLACKLSEKGSKVLLVDCDFRIPSLAKIFDLPKSSLGVEQLITKDSPLNKNTITKSLQVITCQPNIKDPSILLDSHRLKSFLRNERSHYDYIILDSPPCLAVGDAAFLATLCDGAILVTGYKQCFLEEVGLAFADLRMAKKLPVYAVINFSEQLPKLGLKSSESRFHKTQKIR